MIKLDPVIIDDKTLWDGYCRCHEYTITQKFLGISSDSVNKPLSYCTRLTGFRPETWADFFVSWFKEIQIWDKQNQKDIKEYGR